ncbi:MAG: hypothetical protein IKN28_09655 [Firmicutes bacterium]|nr:hypothetical protein [Bacillota bacterium]MBR3035307.1 hypothetical protein [Bacillota bacterium]MBR3750125.1 hypothetical protein [Bacillota bacterium]MBR4158312.1 hypothetical protein [Oscillospiraceae bacterium]MBR6970669.1 hypothetical protein [Bacillota bacterium]
MLRIFKACILTVFLETGLFYLLGYRKKDDVTIVVCANVITNLVLNLTIAWFFPGGPGSFLLLLETAVVIAEYLIYAKAFGATNRLFGQTLAVNVLSYAAGVVLSAAGLL